MMLGRKSVGPCAGETKPNIYVAVCSTANQHAQAQPQHATWRTCHQKALSQATGRSPRRSRGLQLVSPRRDANATTRAEGGCDLPLHHAASPLDSNLGKASHWCRCLLVAQNTVAGSGNIWQSSEQPRAGINGTCAPNLLIRSAQIPSTSCPSSRRRRGNRWISTVSAGTPGPSHK